jgi:hypothetical protein
MLISERKLRTIVRRALVEQELKEIATFGASPGEHLYVDPSASSVKSTSMKHVMAQAVQHFNMARTFLNDTQKHVRRNTAFLAWDQLIPFERGLIAIADPRFAPFVKGVEENQEKRFMGIVGDADGMFKAADALSPTSIEELQEFLYAFEAVMEAPTGDSSELMRALSGMSAIQREQISFLIRDMLVGGKVTPNFKSMTPEQVEARMETADAAKLKADIEAIKIQLKQNAQPTAPAAPSPNRTSAGTPPQGIRKPRP